MEKFRQRHQVLKTSELPKAIVVEAHNDDFAMWKLLTVVTLGFAAELVTLTDGSMRGIRGFSPTALSERRWHEGVRSAHFAGVTAVHRKDITDGQLSNHTEEAEIFLREQVHNAVLLVAPNEKDENADHRAANTIAKAVAGKEITLYQMGTITGRDLFGREILPDSYVELTGHEALIERIAHELHETQVQDLPHDEWLDVQNVHDITIRNGQRAGVPHAAAVFNTGNTGEAPLENFLGNRLIAAASGMRV